MFEPQIIPIFSKVVYIDYLDIDNNIILKTLEQESFKKIWEEGSTDSLCKVSLNKSILEKKELYTLKEKIFTVFNKYTKKILKYNYNDFKMTTSWITKTNINQSSLIHNHNNSMLSGVLYLKTEPKKAKIIFHNHANNSSWKLSTSENNIYNSDKYTFDMSENLIIFFPSETHHQIKASEQLTERISLAFNFCPIGQIGELGSDSFMEVK